MKIKNLLSPSTSNNFYYHSKANTRRRGTVSLLLKVDFLFKVVKSFLVKKYIFIYCIVQHFYFD